MRVVRDGTVAVFLLTVPVAAEAQNPGAAPRNAADH